MTLDELRAAGIPLPGSSELAVLEAASAFDWMRENTTLQFDEADTASIEALPACAKLFVVKYVETLTHRVGVTSQSIEGLSQSFDASENMQSLIWSLANTLLGNYLKSQVRVTPARRRW